MGVTVVLSAHVVGSGPGLGQAVPTVGKLHPQLVTGPDWQLHRQAYGGRNHLLCGGVRVHLHDGDVDRLVTVLSGCTEDCRTHSLEISQRT